MSSVEASQRHVRAAGIPALEMRNSRLSRGVGHYSDGVGVGSRCSDPYTAFLHPTAFPSRASKSRPGRDHAARHILGGHVLGSRKSRLYWLGATSISLSGASNPASWTPPRKSKPLECLVSPPWSLSDLMTRGFWQQDQWVHLPVMTAGGPGQPLGPRREAPISSPER